MLIRGTYEFEISNLGKVVNSLANLEKLRNLFLDKDIINNAVGPGEPGDFVNGAWHILCHLAAGCAVMRRPFGEMMWVEISHVPAVDIYTATVTVECPSEDVTTFPLGSVEGRALLGDANLLGFVEGSSLGHISARSVKDSPDKFNNNQRQEYDQDVESPKDGGRVWEHWCTVRDIRPGNAIGTSVLEAYLNMVAVCGGRFVAVVARGRTDYDHPTQLAAMVRAGFISHDQALVDVTPTSIPMEVEPLIYTASPRECVMAAKRLAWPASVFGYYMFARRIDKWNPIDRVRKQIDKLG